VVWVEHSYVIFPIYSKEIGRYINKKLSIMKITNSWASPNRQKDKFEIKLRISSLTVFQISLDFSNKYYHFVILNVGVTL
jgi:hypothetical protein